MKFYVEIAEKICREMGIEFHPEQKGVTIGGKELPDNFSAAELFSNNHMKHWIDNADSYICPVCGLEVNSPAIFPGCRCPRCGFQDEKDVKIAENI